MTYTGTSTGVSCLVESVGAGASVAITVLLLPAPAASTEGLGVISTDGTGDGMGDGEILGEADTVGETLGDEEGLDCVDVLVHPVSTINKTKRSDSLDLSFFMVFLPAYFNFTIIQQKYPAFNRNQLYWMQAQSVQLRFTIGQHPVRSCGGEARQTHGARAAGGDNGCNSGIIA